MTDAALPARTRSPRYTGVAMALHWAMALLLVGMVFGGWYMGDLKDAVLSNKALIGAVGYTGPDEAQLQVLSNRVEWMYQLHKSIGITLLTLTVARVVWRLMNPPPPLATDMKSWEKQLSHAVHMGFYALMVAIPLLGWMMVSVPHDFSVPTVIFGVISWPKLPFITEWEGVYGSLYWLHGKMGWVMFGLLALHVGGAVKHDFFGEEDGVLKRMIPGFSRWLGTSDDPVAAPRGFTTAFGAAIGLFGLIAATPMVANALQGTETLEANTTGVSANWAVDYDTAKITFSGVHDGKDFTGSFANWTADVAFFADDLNASEVAVTVDLSSASTGTKLHDDSLKAAEWFDLKTSTQATVSLNDFQAGGTQDAYTANATLTLKGLSVTTPLAFTLMIEGDVATLDGGAVFQRGPLNLGQSSDPGADWVSEEITVRVTGTATRIGPAG